MPIMMSITACQIAVLNVLKQMNNVVNVRIFKEMFLYKVARDITTIAQLFLAYVPIAYR